ncbi:type I restriction-modification system subunit M N-terminal domain-containing protein [Blastococcus brunescens]|uniref:Type I restriction-modification system subunit M N-terminal domain-containing protein n=1 Tax=Blastococcus brunescens TaxID=1564165 RepID=A0ABZ1AW79_9ACTN|nr:type I restriction-modification system subunit M N-terminal domain-containing protein [Blastococcus sp. BMG 8361]WRL62196.1 type I restriction-modification system subunit M N-terminal domain-containing protein [Blastococcus sp. BMG 8361]
MDGFEGKVQFVWQVADLLRGDYKPAEYRGVILPLLVLRRLDAVLEETKPKVLARAEQLKGVTDNPDLLLRQAAGVPFYNVSPLTFSKLLDSPNNLAQQLRSYIGAFSPVLRRCWRSTGSTSRSAGWTTPGCSTWCSASSPTWTCVRRSCPTTRWATSSRSCCAGSLSSPTRRRVSTSPRARSSG